jgi:nifR3 family TIM-barrel protein
MLGSLPQLRLGSVAVDFPVGQAALSGYSDWPMRVIARRLGAAYTVGEVMLDQFVLSVSKGRKVKRFIRVTDEDRPCGAQLMGAQPEELCEAARKVAAAGFDVIDLNFACPVRKVLSRCRGGHLLEAPDVALEMVARVREVIPPQVPLTLKMRRGTDDDPASEERFWTIFDGGFQRGVAAIAVHPRSVRQKYEGRASWEFLARVKQHAGTRTVLGSGDLFTAQDFLDMFAQTGVDGALAARGAIGNPWIFREVRALAAGKPLPPPPGLDEQREVMLDQYRLAEEVYGPRRAATVMGKFGIKYSRLHPQAEEVRDAFAASHSPEQWRRVVDRWYTKEEEREPQMNTDEHR